MNNTGLSFVSDYLQKLGFSESETRLYITLVQNGPSTLLEISRAAKIERTRLYRRLDELCQRGLIEEVPQYKKRVIKAADLSTIELMVKERERQDKILAASFDEFSGALDGIQKPFPGNNVVYYRGTEGMRQMTWHVLRCEGLFRTYSYSFWNEILGDSFVLRLNQEMLVRNFKVHDIYSDEYIEYKKNWLKSDKKPPAGDWSFWESRYLPEKLVRVHLNIDVYNDTVAYYYWQDEEIFGVEICNKRVADIQKQIHDVLWGMAKKMPHFNWTKNGLEK
jgi:DNA-binding MarR family transcriptional regulator